MNLFSSPFFAQRSPYLIQFVCMRQGITDRCPIVCLRLSRVQQSICFRSFKSLAAHFVRHEYRLVHHTASLYDSLVNGQCLSALALSDRLRRLGFRFSNEPSEWIWNLNLSNNPRDPEQNLEANSFSLWFDSLCHCRSKHFEKFCYKKYFKCPILS